MKSIDHSVQHELVCTSMAVAVVQSQLLTIAIAIADFATVLCQMLMQVAGDAVIQTHHHHHHNRACCNPNCLFCHRYGKKRLLSSSPGRQCHTHMWCSSHARIAATIFLKYHMYPIKHAPNVFSCSVKVSSWFSALLHSCKSL